MPFIETLPAWLTAKREFHRSPNNICSKSCSSLQPFVCAEIVPVLLKAIQDPTDHTNKALSSLLDTHFVHFIDAPSLALIMPVVERAFADRRTDVRKMSSQIIGNMYSLTDHKDLSPYLPNVIPGLKMALLDPAPEVRAISAHALGAMVRGMGEAGFEELVPWLMKTLTSEQSTVDRSGAAQGQ